MRRAVLATAAVLVSLGLAGCSNTVVLDREKLEQTIEEEVLNQTGVTLTEVDCPESPEMTEGSEFECAITADDGTEAIVDVVVQDDEGNVAWEVRG